MNLEHKGYHKKIAQQYPQLVAEYINFRKEGYSTFNVGQTRCHVGCCHHLPYSLLSQWRTSEAAIRIEQLPYNKYHFLATHSL
jgi:hypothetical protein